MTKAAGTLGITQPALSAMLRKLEAEVGTRLMRRAGRGVELTEAGAVFLDHAERTLRQAEGAVHAVRQLVGLETGTVRVGAGATAAGWLVPRVVSLIRAKHPGLRFFVREAGSNAVALAVLAGELDLGIVTLPLALPISAGESSRLVKVPLAEDELRLIVPAGHALARREPSEFSWKDLAGEPVVGFEAGSAVREMIDLAAARAGRTLDYVMEVRSIASITRMVRAGIGVGFVSKLALDEEPQRAGVQSLTCKDTRLARRLAIVMRNDRDPSPAAVLFGRVLRTGKV